MVGYRDRGGAIFMRWVVGLATVGVAALASSCSSAATGEAGTSGHLSSISERGAMQTLAAAPGAVKAAKTFTVDGTGTQGGQKVRITADFDYSGVLFKGHLDMKATGGTPKDPRSPVPYDEDSIVIDDDEYMQVGALPHVVSAADYAAVVKAVDGRHWIEQASVPNGFAASDMRLYLMIGSAGQVSYDSMEESLAALLSSGLFVPDTVAGADGTFQYTATLDEKSLPTTKYDAKQQDAIRQSFGSTVGAEKIELWLAPTGLPTEIKFTDVSRDIPPAADLDDGTMRFTWGKPVTVTRPAASDVVTRDALRRLFPTFPPM